MDAEIQRGNQRKRGSQTESDGEGWQKDQQFSLAGADKRP